MAEKDPTAMLRVAKLPNPEPIETEPVRSGLPPIAKSVNEKVPVARSERNEASLLIPQLLRLIDVIGVVPAPATARGQTGILPYGKVV
jgi:hypothetical protein